MLALAFPDLLVGSVARCQQNLLESDQKTLEHVVGIRLRHFRVALTLYKAEVANVNTNT